MRKLEKRIAERDANLIKLRQHQIEQNRGLPPSICGKHKEEVAGKCPFFQEAPKPIGTEFIKNDIQSERDGFTEQLAQDTVEIEHAQNELKWFEAKVSHRKEQLDQTSETRKPLLLRLRELDVQIAVTQAFVKQAQSAEELRESFETKLNLSQKRSRHPNSFSLRFASHLLRAKLEVIFLSSTKHCFESWQIISQKVLRSTIPTQVLTMTLTAT